MPSIAAAAPNERELAKRRRSFQASKCKRTKLAQGIRKKTTIEDAFAAAIGQKAIDRLTRVRSADRHAFDQSGKKPMAPPGQHDFPIPGVLYDEKLMGTPRSRSRKRKRKSSRRTPAAQETQQK